MAEFGAVLQQHYAVLSKDVVVGGDVEIRDDRHDFGVGVGTVSGSLAGGEGC